ncbi:MAG: proline--tRNA ligase [Myxococcales bacterium]|nr:proline--tRNA ligase [Myxococcales bacterium]USN51060.1 MAG: proline--tRNA ligase [Myxococcales bacterium]
MFVSKLFLPTMREVPGDAVVVSHQLMLRAGLIRKVAAGIYNYLPLGFRVIQKISAIIEQEMDQAGAQELLMPMVQPADLWKESGRYSEYGPELLRFKDRKDTDFCLGPTHEEVICALVRDNVKSYKNLPLTLYQIQTKFRDEVRPRFGLMRGREFIMKDAYSFCVDKKSQDQVYQDMWDAYHRIFKRCGLKFRAVRAATGSIGGDMSHEFQVLAQSGEDAIASCEACGYAANVELAHIATPKEKERRQEGALLEVDTRGHHSVDEQAKILGVGKERIIKTLVYEIDDVLCLVLVRGNQEVSEVKLKEALKADIVQLAPDKKVADEIGPIGFIGPVNTGIRVVADNDLKNELNMFAGANKVGCHWSGVDVLRDIDPEFFDIRQAQAQDPCPECRAPFNILRGIEVGHIFYLGTKYSKAMSATVQNEHGENIVMEMGCYGIGVGRTAAAAIEQNHDDKGIIWPVAIAPYHVHLVSLGVDKEVSDEAHKIYENLSNAGVEVLYDDRDERAGVKLNDADLIGCPLRITLGKRGIKNRELEVLPRAEHSQGVKILSLDSDYVGQIKAMLDQAKGQSLC